MKLKLSKKGFTLAEVLITLTIIGVIAAITIPNLARKWEDTSQISGLKTAYSLLDNALKMAVRENGQLTDWTWPSASAYSADNANYFANELAKYLKVSKICKASTTKACFSSPFGYNISNNGNIKSGRYKRLNGEIVNIEGLDWTDGERKAIMILENNIIIAVSIGYLNSTTAFFDSVIRIDINGTKGPNRFGHDVFFFSIDSNGLIFKDKTKQNCNKDSRSASSCVYWVIKHGNMDYKYRDVSAEW